MAIIDHIWTVSRAKKQEVGLVEKSDFYKSHEDRSQRLCNWGWAVILLIDFVNVLLLGLDVTPSPID